MKAALFVYVWPEPRSSAAGVRTVELCRNLQGLGYEVTAFSPCRPNEASAELESFGIRAQPCAANDSSVDNLLLEIRPELVIYDRFVMEEQFGWRAREAWPSALHIVDTQDLHTVRRARERALTAAQAAPPPDLERELSSLYRADASLVVSNWERNWLLEQGYPPERVFWLPFGAEKEEKITAFGDRSSFVFLGNFRHPPNLDAVNQLTATIWPAIRGTLPHAELFLYGAYPPASVSALHGKNGIRVPGPVKFHREALAKHRVLLAPLRFGAGIKGKILEAWATGTPVVGTEIAMEGLRHPAHDEDFVTHAIELHENENAWKDVQTTGFQALEPFSPALLLAKLQSILEAGFASRAEWRGHPTGRMLRHHLHNSTKYFSRWIEAKNR